MLPPLPPLLSGQMSYVPITYMRPRLSQALSVDQTQEAWF